MTTTILITGASSGLGAEMARQFHARGYDLALCARRTEKLTELKAELEAADSARRVGVRALDVNDHDQVFEVFRAFADDFGEIDRFVINAGIGKGAKLGTGNFEANKQTAMTNFVAALAQAEAATEILRKQQRGHFVMVSSMSALRGLPKQMATYGASKAGAAHLAEGMRTEFHGTDILITVLYPGYIVSEMNDFLEENRPKMMARTEDGVRAMVEAIEKEKGSACVPPLPWAPLSVVMKHAPLPIFKKLI